VVFAAPVGPPKITATDLDADEVICAAQPAAYRSVGQAYRDFRATSDDDVAHLLALATARAGLAQGAGGPPALDTEVVVLAGPVRLPGHLSLPEKTSGVVVFAHGSGSSRHSPRNRFIAGSLQARGIGTLLVADIAKQVRERRGTHLAALVEVDTPGQAFLASLGFRERGQRRTLMIRRAG